MEGIDKNDGTKEVDSKFREEIYSNAVRAGKRTYFFDVKSTRKDEYYLTITESKKRFEQDGKYHYEKHKIFLYKEDFEKFKDGLKDVITYIEKNQPGGFDVDTIAEDDEREEVGVLEKDYTNVDFDDLSN